MIHCNVKTTQTEVEEVVVEFNMSVTRVRDPWPDWSEVARYPEGNRATEKTAQECADDYIRRSSWDQDAYRTFRRKIITTVTTISEEA